MVAGEDGDAGQVERRRQRLLHEADLQCQSLQSAEGAGRFCLAVDLVLQGGGDAAVGPGNMETHRGLLGSG